MAEKKYDANSVEQLTFREGVRARIGIYLGSADHTGVIAGLLELVNNATDEALVCPSATQIELTIGKDWASCRDYGRGMPHGKNSFSDEVMINLLTENHSGAKFNENAYGGKSRGLNGTGSAATCCSSDVFEITSYRDKAAWYMKFIEGVPQFATCQKLPLGKEKQGTYIKYKPSASVFNAEPINFDFKEICNIIKEYSYFNKGITFIVTNAETNEVIKYCSKNGLLDFAADIVKSPVHKTPIHYATTEDEVDIEIVAQWTKGKERMYIFSNGGENPAGGTPGTGMKAAITSFAKKNISDEFDGDMARSGLIYICSVNLKNPIYDGQTKSRITNPNLRGIAQRAMTQALNDFKANTAEFNNVINFLTTKQRAEAQADKIRESIMNHEKEMASAAKKKILNSDKLREARKLGADSMLVLVEGDSAGGSISIGRQKAPGGDQIGILMLRGKAINALANPIDKVLENDEVKLLLQALGITYGQKYNSKKLRYGKIAICSDSDFDGSHIGLLVMAIIQKLCPELIAEGRLYWLKAPICKLDNKGKTWYYYTEQEIADRKETSGEMTFFKGIGQMQKKDLQESLFSPSNQHLEQLAPTPDGVEALLALMGEDVEPRKEYVQGIDFGGFKL